MRTSILRSRGAAAVLAFAGVLFVGLPAALSAEPTKTKAGNPAAEPEPTREELERRLKELEENVQDLRKDTRQIEVKAEEATRLKPIAGWQDGFFIQSPEGDFKLNVGGYVQADGRYFVGNDNKSGRSEFTFRRIRPDLRGKLFKYFEFRLLTDFAPGNSVTVQDAYVDAKFVPYLVPRAGKFKGPVGLERLQSGTALLFAERAFPTSLVPNRDIGFQVYGDFFNQAFRYELAVTNGDVDGGSNNGDLADDKDFEGRIFALPFKDTPIEPLRGLGVGVGGTYGQVKGSPSGPDLPNYKTDGQQTFFTYVVDNPATAGGTAVANGDRYRVSPQAYYYWGPFGSMFEWVSSSQAITKGNANSQIDNTAWQIRGEYVITGENATYKGVTPAANFDPFKGTWGAFEIAARYSELSIDDEAFSLGFADPTRSAHQAREFAVGVNWFLNKSILVVLDYFQTDFFGGAPKGNRPNEEVIISRVQFVF